MTGALGLARRRRVQIVEPLLGRAEEATPHHAPTRKQIYAGTPPPTRITPKAAAEFERVRATPEYAGILAGWEGNCAAWRRHELASDAAFLRMHSKKPSAP